MARVRRVRMGASFMVGGMEWGVGEVCCLEKIKDLSMRGKVYLMREREGKSMRIGMAYVPSYQ